MSQNEELNKQLQLATDLQLEMMGDMYNKMTASCHQKCISTRYRESELSKGESVCIDRCVGKFLDIYEKIGKKINTMTMDEEQANKASQPNLNS